MIESFSPSQLGYQLKCGRGFGAQCVAVLCRGQDTGFNAHLVSRLAEKKLDYFCIKSNFEYLFVQWKPFKSKFSKNANNLHADVKYVKIRSIDCGQILLLYPTSVE